MTGSSLAQSQYYQHHHQLCAEYCGTLRRSASRTWDWLQYGQDPSHIDVSEETLTGVNLLEMQQHHPGLTLVSKFSRYDEGHSTGADWDWWFTNAAQDDWRVLRIQAKKLDRRTARYEHINHQIGNDPNRAQLDLLINSSASIGAVPLYCFYNYWSAPGIVVRCATGFHRANFMRLKHQGCTIASAEHIKRLDPTDRMIAAAANERAVPWHCLACGGLLPQYLDWIDAHLLTVLGVTTLPRRRSHPPNYILGMLANQSRGGDIIGPRDQSDDNRDIVDDDAPAPTVMVTVQTTSSSTL